MNDLAYNAIFHNIPIPKVQNSVKVVESSCKAGYKTLTQTLNCRHTPLIKIC